MIKPKLVILSVPIIVMRIAIMRNKVRDFVKYNKAYAIVNPKSE
jgi:hypothetical protein